MAMESIKASRSWSDDLTAVAKYCYFLAWGEDNQKDLNAYIDKHKQKSRQA